VRAIVTAGLIVAACGVVAAETAREARARTAAIRATAAAIEQEAQRYAGGDWEAWYEHLGAFRADLLSRIERGEGNLTAVQANPANAPSGLLRVDGHPPMFEYPSTARYLAAGEDKPSRARERAAGPAFIAVSEWLKQKNIDLLLVPVPRIPEVYADRIATGAPPDGIIAPQLRRFLLELSNADVEVVDLLPVFLKARSANPAPLYLVADGHWSDRAQRLAAAEIGRRLKRYDFVMAALKEKPLFTSAPARLPFHGANYKFLTTAEHKEVANALAAMSLTHVTTTQGGKPFQDAPESPVVVIGDSFTHYFQNEIKPGSGIDALLSKEINIPVSNVSTAGGTTAPIKDFLRRPELLRDRRVVVWIFNAALLGYPKEEWALPSLPK
jgi:hypothetical protein